MLHMMRLTLITLVALIGINLAAVPTISQTAARLPVPRAGIAIASTDKYVIFWGGQSSTREPAFYDAADLFDLASGQFITIPQTSGITDHIFLPRLNEIYSTAAQGPYVAFTKPGSFVALLDTNAPSYSTYQLDWGQVPAGVSTQHNIVLSDGRRFDFFDPVTKSWSVINATAVNGTLEHAINVGDDIYFAGSQTTQLMTVLNSKTMDQGFTEPPYYLPPALSMIAPYINKVFFIGDTLYFYTSIGVLFYNRTQAASSFKKLDYVYHPGDAVHMQLAHLIVSAPRSVRNTDEMTLVILDTTAMQWSNYTVPVPKGRNAMAMTAYQERYIVIAGGYDWVNNGTDVVFSDEIVMLEFDLPKPPGATLNPTTTSASSMVMLMRSALLCSVLVVFLF